MGKAQRQQAKPHASSRSARPTSGSTQYHRGKPSTPSNSTHFASVSAKVRPTLKIQVPVQLTGSSRAQTPAIKPSSTSLTKTLQQRGKPQASFKSSTLPSAAPMHKTQQQRGKAQASFKSSTVPTSAPMTKTQQQRGKPQASFKSSTLPSAASMTKTQQQRGKPQASFKSSTLPSAASMNKTQPPRGKPQASFKSSTVPTSAPMTKTQQQRGKPQAPLPSFSGPLFASTNKSKFQKDKPQLPFHSTSAPVSTAFNKTKMQIERKPSTEHRKRKLEESIRSSNIPASGKTSHHIAKPQSHTRSTSATASALSPKGTSQKHETECLRSKRKKNIDEFFASKIDIDKTEKKASVKIVDGVLSKIMSHVKGQSGGGIYCPNHVKAGSYPVNTKIGKADEFDTNICLKLEQKDINVRRNGKINYAYPQSEHSTNMNVKCELGKDKKGFKIPNGNAIATVNRCNIPESLRHGNDLVPREMRYDLYHKIRTAINELNLKGVDLSRDAHGPALTMTIHPHKHSPIKHDISVDVTLSLPCDEPIKNWPRRATKKAFSESLIKDVKDTGTHLVPKKDEFWSVSYSRAERELFSKIDGGNGCRKFVYKILKKHLQTCKSRSSNGLPELSSHILKTQLLWSCEKHTTPGYWHHDKRDICLIDTISDLEETLKRGRLSDYFDTEVDVLKGKDSNVLKELTDYLHNERCHLELMQ